MSFQAGLQALQEGRFQDAVRALEAVGTNVSDPDFLQARMELVRAYHGNGQLQKAVVLGRELANYPHPNVSNWARAALATLEAEARYAESAQQLTEGQAALQQGRFADAIKALEDFYRSPGINLQSDDAVHARMELVRAYDGAGDRKKARSIAERLVENRRPEVRNWAREVLDCFTAEEHKRELEQLLKRGLQAFKHKNFSEAVSALEEYCQQGSSKDYQSETFQKARMQLVQAYRGEREHEKALHLCQKLTEHPRREVRDWGETMLAKIEEDIQTELKKYFQVGLQALQEKRYHDAIAALEEYCRRCGDDNGSETYREARMGLIKTYRNTRQYDRAIAICEDIARSGDEMRATWAKQQLAALHIAKARPIVDGEGSSPNRRRPSKLPSRFPKANRAAQLGVKLAMQGVASSLTLASTVTVGLVFGMLLVLVLAAVGVQGENRLLGLTVAASIAVVLQLVIFFISPTLMDIIQSLLYGTKWVGLGHIRRSSPEAAETIERICRDRKLPVPRIGLIDDQNPTAFTYGSLPSTARVVVSQGLFTYLDDDETAAVYAHELGHVVHWDFAVMTLASTLVQLTYLIYTFTRDIKFGGNRGRELTHNVALAAYVFYVIGTYLLLYLSRTREYYADHFAAEVTGNPNALSRALVKIAYGLVEEEKEQVRQGEKRSKLVEGTRALGIYDAQAASSSGTAYSITSEPEKVGRVFLWDLFNPWGWWMELQSTHPLTGKRIRALSTYAEQLGLDVEFNFAAVVKEGRQLSKRKLYSNFLTDLILFRLDALMFFLGLVAGTSALWVGASPIVFPSLILVFFGSGVLVKTLFMYPDFKRAPATDIMTLMSDPYASPLRGKPVKLDAELIGRGDAGNRFGSDLKMQDKTGTILARYSSRFGPIGNFLFGLSQVEFLIGRDVRTTGWFRRGIIPQIDLLLLEGEDEPVTMVRSYHRFWSLVVGGVCLILGFILPQLLPVLFV
ncbi:Zn-dependent protease with chaperone function [Rubidibacter lacunae KORDI 51-2]|uniref:Zn-dependent protease with chaperone function n=1 Tax=Rubidibacter lacunae KORDI 51-2 TaxID=582515 RepID=U5DNG0_9CHRO|nr:M48 family metalloprotease [Rubidibacter lacunae]ERN42134.1 Zn-dependent protease with chaperone function [Rubidibacter lacunae KORDI 51-2]